MGAELARKTDQTQGGLNSIEAGVLTLSSSHDPNTVRKLARFLGRFSGELLRDFPDVYGVIVDYTPGSTPLEVLVTAVVREVDPRLGEDAITWIMSSPRRDLYLRLNGVTYEARERVGNQVELFGQSMGSSPDVPALRLPQAQVVAAISDGENRQFLGALYRINQSGISDPQTGHPSLITQSGFPPQRFRGWLSRLGRPR